MPRIIFEVPYKVILARVFHKLEFFTVKRREDARLAIRRDAIGQVSVFQELVDAVLRVITSVFETVVLRIFLS